MDTTWTPEEEAQVMPYSHGLGTSIAAFLARPAKKPWHWRPDL
jgi:hypothetical protein